ncbi:MAG: carboxypeptidase regulatory-like domain-containing protein [Planctomycetota bacterium]
MANSKTRYCSHTGLALAALAMLFAQGCHKSEVQLGAVQGKVTLDGQPLADATVRFIPTAGGRTAFGRTDTKGHYTMLYSASASGALVGSMRVEITTADPDAPTPTEKVPAKYNVSSELTAEVGSKSNVLDFPLTSK